MIDCVCTMEWQGKYEAKRTCHADDNQKCATCYKVILIICVAMIMRQVRSGGENQATTLLSSSSAFPVSTNTLSSQESCPCQENKKRYITTPPNNENRKRKAILELTYAYAFSLEISCTDFARTRLENELHIIIILMYYCYWQNL